MNNKLSPIKLWRNIAIIYFVIGVAFALIGTVLISDKIVVQWNFDGEPTNLGGKWFLWVMALMSFLSMFTHKSFCKSSVGNTALSVEMAGAVSSGLTALWAVINTVLVIYNLCNSNIVLVIGTCIIVANFIIFSIIAHFQKRRGR